MSSERSCGTTSTLYYAGPVFAVQAVSDQSNVDSHLKVDSISRLWGDSRNYDIAHAGLLPYKGTLTRDDVTLTACTCSNYQTFIIRTDNDP